MEPTTAYRDTEVPQGSSFEEPPSRDTKNLCRNFTDSVVGEKSADKKYSNKQICRATDDGLPEDSEVNTSRPLLHKTTASSSDEETQTSKEVSNSRSGSTTVRFDGIILDVLNSTTIHVDWCPIHVSTNETLCGYKIRYAALDNSSYNEIFVPHGISSYTITGLRPNTEYDISVNAVDKRENVIQTCGWVRQKTYELEDNQHKKFDAPYLTAVAAIALLLVALVVPVTFLFVRNCGQCSSPSQTEKTALGKNQEELDNGYIETTFEHRRTLNYKNRSSSDSRTRLPRKYKHYRFQLYIAKKFDNRGVERSN